MTGVQTCALPISGIKLPDLKLALPDIDLDWGSLTLPELLLSLPRLNISGLSIDIDYARLLPAWPNVSLPNLSNWFKSNPSAAGSTGGLSLNLDWAKLSLPELLISLPKLNLPGFDLGLLGFGGLPSFSSASLSKLPLIGSLVDDLPFKFNFNDDGFSIYGQLGIKYQDNFTLSGNFGLDKNNTAGTISFLGQDAIAKLQVGEYGIGAQGADVALVLESTGFALEAKGELYAQLADYVKLSADEASVQINTTGKSYTGKVVTVGDPADGGLSYTFGTLANGTRAVAVTNANLVISDFVRISGNLAASDSTANFSVRSSAGATSTITGAKVLAFGGSDLSAFAGNGASSQKLGLQIGDLDFGLAFITETLAAGSTATARSWTALKANAGRIDAAMLAASLGVSAAGSVPHTTLGVQLEGEERDPGHFAGHINVVNTSPGPVDRNLLPMVRLASAFSTDLSSLVLDRLDIALGGGQLSGTARLDPHRASLDLRAAGINLRTLYSTLRETSLAGPLTMELEGARQVARGELQQEGFSLAFDASKAGERLDLRSFRAQAQGGEASGSGTVWLRRTAEATISLALARLDPSRFGDYPTGTLNGTALVEARLGGGAERRIAGQIGRAHV